MPIKEIENIIIDFTYGGKEYQLVKYRIFDSDGNYVCDCDFTGTNWYGDKELMEFVAKMCVGRFLHGNRVGFEKGQVAKQKEFREVLGI